MTQALPTALSASQRRMNLASRTACVALFVFFEKFLLNFFVDFNGAQAATGLGAVVRNFQHWGFRFLVAFAVALALFGYVRSGAELRRVNTAVRGIPLRLPWLLLHGAAVLALVPLSHFLYGRGAPTPFAATAALWLLFALAAVLTLLAAMGPWAMWRMAAHALGMLWLYAAGAAAAATFAMQWSERLWAPTARMTFELVRILLIPFVPTLHSDPSNLVLYTDRFAVQVAPVCSGLEGIGLMLAFCCAWLLCFRREYIFPRALCLIPVGLLAIYLLNGVRIAALVLIGHAGFPAVAVYGFHSQAGWIAFNCAAGGVVVASRRSRFIRRASLDRVDLAGENPTAAYLMPLLSILAAGMLSRALSSGFETLYALRLVAGAIALGFCWPKLTGLDWRFSWRSIIAGLAVFLLWMFAAHFLSAPSAMPEALSTMPHAHRILWIIARVMASVTTVPLAEELAYRGYLLRRITASQFESVRFETVGPWGLLVSSVVFGLGSGFMWLPGTASGVIYGVLVIRTGRIGEAVSAHVTANALLATWVLTAGQWQLW